MCKLMDLVKSNLHFNTYSLEDDMTQDALGYAVMVLDGVVSINISLSDHDPVVCSLVTEGMMLNAEVVSSPSSEGLYSYVCESRETTVAKIPMVIFREQLQRKPELYPLILRQLSYNFVEATECTAIIGTLKAPERVIYCIERMAELGATEISGRRLAALTAKGRTRAQKVKRALGIYPLTRVVSEAGTEIYKAGK